MPNGLNVKRQKLVSPSILSADFSKLGQEIKDVIEAGADWIHVDVMDGNFVPNLTIGPPVIKSLRPMTDKTLDVHLMIDKPENLLDAFIDAGSDIITIHVESTNQAEAVLKKVRSRGRKAGITLKPGTPVSKILPYLNLVDLVLVMTVEPGFSGQKFMTDQVSKISDLRKEIDKRNLSIFIEVDGGINKDTAKLCSEADVFVAGNAVFKSANYKKAIAELKNV